MRTPCIHASVLAVLSTLAPGVAQTQPASSRLPELTARQPDEPVGKPPVFAGMTLDEALKSIEGTQKILVVKATAVWCAPCKTMDRTTWRDEKVIRWFKDNGVAIAVDVDELPDTAQRLKIQAMPTMVAFREGKELDRVVGMRTADQLVDWLDAAKRGEKASDATRRKAEANPDDVDARHALARQLAQDNEFEKSAEQYAWLWENVPALKPAMIPVRGSFMAGEMERLAQQSPEAKARFVALRDATEKRLAEPAGAESIDDFIVLNKIVNDQDRTLAWFDKVKADPASAPVLERSSFRLEELLEARGRWADLGTFMYPRPVEAVERAIELNRLAVESAARAPAGMQDMMKATQDRSHNQRVARLYASLLAAKRDAEAERVLAVLGPNDSAGRAVLACITKALEIGEARESMRAPLDAAWKKGAGIKAARDGLNRALKHK